MLRLFKSLITFRRIFHIQPLKILIKLPARVNEPPRRVNNNVYNIFMTPGIPADALRQWKKGPKFRLRTMTNPR